VPRVRLSVDVDPELRRRVRIAAASKDQSVKEWLEDVLERELKRTDEDYAWMESDLSRLGEYEIYEWAEGELENEAPMRYEPGRGLRVEGGKRSAYVRRALDSYRRNGE
jgi:predicted transcriptional regulator